MERTASAPVNVSVGVASVQLVAANPNRVGLRITTLTNNSVISLGLGTAAVLNKGITLIQNNFDVTWVMDDTNLFTGAINAIANAAAQVVAVQEFTV